MHRAPVRAVASHAEARDEPGRPEPTRRPRRCRQLARADAVAARIDPEGSQACALAVRLSATASGRQPDWTRGRYAGAPGWRPIRRGRMRSGRSPPAALAAAHGRVAGAPRVPRRRQAAGEPAARELRRLLRPCRRPSCRPPSRRRRACRCPSSPTRDWTLRVQARTADLLVPRPQPGRTPHWAPRLTRASSRRRPGNWRRIRRPSTADRPAPRRMPPRTPRATSPHPRLAAS